MLGFGITFLVRLITYLGGFVLSIGLLLFSIYIVSKVIQLGAHILGYEIKDFGSWLFSFKKNKQNSKSPLDK